jgi:NAD(P)H-hydrate epimerase
VLKFQGPVILDADALNLLARTPGVWNFRSDAVLTPHPGEARRLAEGFGISTGGSREEFASRLASRLGAIVALKGFRTCVAAPDGRVSVNTSGGPELAMAGSGDVLAGIIAAFAAQCEELFDAVKLAVYFHGAAGDRGRGTVTADELPRLAAECAHDQTWW